MKTYHIKDLLKKDLLIVEAKDEKIAWAIIFQKYGVKAVSYYTLLGKPDEIKEEDVVNLVENWEPLDSKIWVYNNYKEGGIEFKTALESFNSALESEIYWVNPFGKEPKEPECECEECYEDFEIKYNDFMIAQEKTFNKKRTLIFVKN